MSAITQERLYPELTGEVSFIEFSNLPSCSNSYEGAIQVQISGLGGLARSEHKNCLRNCFRSKIFDIEYVAIEQMKNIGCIKAWTNCADELIREFNENLLVDKEGAWLGQTYKEKNILQSFCKKRSIPLVCIKKAPTKYSSYGTFPEEQKKYFE